jgi:serine/threonine protein kinase
VSSQTAAVIDRMISPNPENRYSSYAELIKDLEEALESARDRKNNPPLEKDSPVVKTKPDSTRILLLLWLLVTLSITVFFFVYFIAGIF